MVTKSGLWIKDEVNQNKYIIKSTYIDNNYLINTIINEFDSDFKLVRTIQSEKIDVREKNWIIYNPLINIKNNTETVQGSILIYSNFDSEKINNLFSNITSFDMIRLFNLKKDYNKLGYSTDEITIQILKLLTTPFFYSMLTIFSITIMFNLTKNKSLLFHIITGVFLSVIVYYINFIFNSLGNNGKIPVYVSIFFPLFIISILSLIGLLNVNEK
jgi:lipopolysaccharide export system permease protein